MAVPIWTVNKANETEIKLRNRSPTPSPPLPQQYTVVVRVSVCGEIPCGFFPIFCKVMGPSLAVSEVAGDEEVEDSQSILVGNIGREADGVPQPVSVCLSIKVKAPPSPPPPSFDDSASVGDSFIGFASPPPPRPSPGSPDDTDHLAFHCDLPIRVTVTLSRLGGWPSPDRCTHLARDASTNAPPDTLPVLCLTGIRDAGKSTVVTVLLGRLSRTNTVYLADIDPGQPVASTAGHFYVRTLGPACEARKLREERTDYVIFMGDSTIRSLEPTKAATRRVAAEARARAIASRRAGCCDACAGALVLLNTHGWITDVGLEHITAALTAFGATALLHLQEGQQVRKGWPTNSTFADIATLLPAAVSDAPVRTWARAAERTAAVQHAMTVQPLRVARIPFSQVVLGYAADDRVMPEHVLTVAQGRLVSLVVGGDVRGTPGQRGSVSLRVAAATRHEHGSVVGSAVLRGVDPLSHTFYLSTWLDDETLAQVTQVWVGHESVAAVPAQLLPLVGGVSAYQVDHVLPADAALVQVTKQQSGEHRSANETNDSRIQQLAIAPTMRQEQACPQNDGGASEDANEDTAARSGEIGTPSRLAQSRPPGVWAMWCEMDACVASQVGSSALSRAASRYKLVINVSHCTVTKVGARMTIPIETPWYKRVQTPLIVSMFESSGAHTASHSNEPKSTRSRKKKGATTRPTTKPVRRSRRTRVKARSRTSRWSCAARHERAAEANVGVKSVPDCVCHRVDDATQGDEEEACAIASIAEDALGKREWVWQARVCHPDGGRNDP
eukprot:CAMPEP_0170730052 /NCGR_PEP_ID=MMETSP0437-20130122/337_1 /TAXON_ID=0 /ORGANISM="Sexangularia sp." /LENGTH=784 /DNA_ID=CAMNT_0011068245 /DNA_START=49 /DNA_END=2404 /DNA_ORIENTATION=-